MQNILKHLMYRIELQCIIDCQFNQFMCLSMRGEMVNNKLILNLKLINPSVGRESYGNLTECLCVCLCLCTLGECLFFSL